MLYLLVTKVFFFMPNFKLTDSDKRRLYFTRGKDQFCATSDVFTIQEEKINSVPPTSDSDKRRIYFCEPQRSSCNEELSLR